jgi:hypothetical protein
MIKGDNNKKKDNEKQFEIKSKSKISIKDL